MRRDWQRQLGSIPARAGEPREAQRWALNFRVYPRACGGTSINHAIGYEKDGLSPRVRGNLGVLSAKD